MTELTRHRTVLIGLLVCLPVAVLGALPAAWHLADQHWSVGGSVWHAHSHDPRVALGSSIEISGVTRKLLHPGGSSRINLEFANRGSPATTLRHVRVTISGIDAPQADKTHPCTRADFRVRPMRSRPFVLPAHASTSLIRLGVPAWQWPRLRMLNRPVNQDGCKGATLTLTYTGYRAWST